MPIENIFYQEQSTIRSISENPIFVLDSRANYQMKNLYILFFPVFFYSCTTNNYIFTSVNNSFLDSTRKGSVKLLTSLDSKQLQGNIRLHKELVAGATVFYNYNILSKASSPFSRFAYEFALSQNFYPVRRPKNSIGLSATLGGGIGKTNYEEVQIPFSYEGRSAKADYKKLYAQAGFSFQRRKIHLNAFYKFNIVRYSYYYNYIFLDKTGGRSSNANAFEPAEIYEFRDKTTLIHELTILMILRPTKRVSYFAEVGFSTYTNLFNPADFRRKEYRDYNSPYVTEQKLNTWRDSFQPNYVPVTFRLGIQLNLGIYFNKN